MNIEHQLTTLKPARQPELARKILAHEILQGPHRRRQRRRDCFVALGGLLTGIAATLLVVVCLPVDKGRQPTAVAVACGTPHSSPTELVPTAPSRLSPTLPPGGRQPTFNTVDTNDETIDLDAWLARYEKLLRNRPVMAYKPTVYTRVVTPSDVNPMEYRNRLMEEI